MSCDVICSDVTRYETMKATAGSSPILRQDNTLVVVQAAANYKEDGFSPPIPADDISLLACRRRSEIKWLTELRCEKHADLLFELGLTSRIGFWTMLNGVTTKWRLKKMRSLSTTRLIHYCLNLHHCYSWISSYNENISFKFPTKAEYYFI